MQRLVRILMLLMVVTGTLGPLVPGAAAAQPCAMMMAMDDGHGMKGTLPACADMSCLVMCALPAPLTTTATNFAWSTVHYATADEVHSGRTIPPAQSPPIA